MKNKARYISICRHHTYWDIQWAELLVSCQRIRMETRTFIRLLTLGVFISLCIIAFCPTEVEGTLITLIALCMLFIISLKNIELVKTCSLPVKGWKIYGLSAGIDLNGAIPAVTPNFRIFDLFWGTTPLCLFSQVNGDEPHPHGKLSLRTCFNKKVFFNYINYEIILLFFFLSFIIIFLAITANDFIMFCTFEINTVRYMYILW